MKKFYEIRIKIQMINSKIRGSIQKIKMNMRSKKQKAFEKFDRLKEKLCSFFGFVNYQRMRVIVSLKELGYMISNLLRTLKYKLIALLKYIYVTYIFALYKFVVQLKFIFFILIVTWIIITKLDSDIAIDFRVEFIGIVYTILIIDLSIFMREWMRKRKFLSMFNKALHSYCQLISYHMTSEYKIDSDKFITFESIYSNITSLDREGYLKTIKTISDFLSHIEKQTNDIINLYENELIIEVKNYLYDTLFTANNNNQYKIYNVGDLLQTRDSDEMADVSFKLTKVYSANMSDDDRMDAILGTILYSNIGIYFAVINNLIELEHLMRKNYNPLFRVDELTKLKKQMKE